MSDTKTPGPKVKKLDTPKPLNKEALERIKLHGEPKLKTMNAYEKDKVE